MAAPLFFSSTFLQKDMSLATQLDQKVLEQQQTLESAGVLQTNFMWPNQKLNLN